MYFTKEPDAQGRCTEKGEITCEKGVYLVWSKDFKTVICRTDNFSTAVTAYANYRQNNK